MGTAAQAKAPWKWGQASPTLAVPGDCSLTRARYELTLKAGSWRSKTWGLFTCVCYLELSNERLQKPGGTCGCRTGGVVVEGMALVEVGRLQGAWSPTNMCDVYCCSCPMPNFKLVLQPPQVRAMFACHHRQPQYSPVPWLMLYGPDSLQACSWLNVRKNCHTDGSRVRKAQFIGCAD